jgi:hypothetical protein
MRRVSSVIEALPKLQKQLFFEKAVKLLRILKNDKQPVNCPVCGKLMIYIAIRLFKGGTVRVLRQPRRMRP